MSWTNNSSTNGYWNAVAFANGIFVAVGDSGKITTSTDGISWATRTSGSAADLYDVAFGGGNFVAVGANGTLLTSPTGEAWTGRASGTAANLRSVAFEAGTFVAAGDGGTILTSPLGTEWTTRDSGETVDLLGVGYGDGRFVVVSRSGMISTSPDGTTRELTQIKRHRRGRTEGRPKGPLTHGKKTPGIGVNEHEQRTEKRLAAEVARSLRATQSRGQKPDARRVVPGLRV